MPVFKYKAETKKHEIKEGVLVAASKKDAGEQLKDQQLSPLFVQETTTGGKKQSGVLFARGVSLVDKANLCRYLSTMINSGLALTEAVEVLAEESDHPKMQQVLDDVRVSLQAGQPLSAAFTQHPDVFDDVFLTLVKAGEESGTLGKSFDYLGKQLYADYELTQKVKSTLAYPIVIVLTTSALGVAMLVFVVPKIAPILLNLNREFPLPVYTLFILRFGLLLSKNIPFFLAGIIFLGFCLFLIFRKPAGRKVLGNFISRIPFFGQLLIKLVLGRFNRTLATLLKSGVPITNSLRVSAATLNLPQFKNMGSYFVEEVEKGVALSEILKKTKLFPSIMIRMVSTGEKTGSIDKLLIDLAQFYEEEVSNALKTLTSVIEPIMMLFIGIGVGVIVISVIAPIYSFVGSLSKSLTTH
ncbi:MAG TPA: type II secretion system F family protein [Candidatus Bathyarchaeia archaeon]|nr:type II secretion system F family protein [Candidatus Bathyarchaeia archaeon]